MTHSRVCSATADPFGGGKRKAGCDGSGRALLVSIGMRRRPGPGQGELVTDETERLVDLVLGAAIDDVVRSLEFWSCSDDDMLDCSEMGRARWLGRLTGKRSCE